MAFATVSSRAQRGLDSPAVSVEVHVSAGLPRFLIVGLPETSVRESKERVRSAILNSGLTFPSARITVNLAPADLPKEGGRFDLPIALGILSATGQLPQTVSEPYEFLGELGLTGELRRIRGAVPSLIANELEGKSLILPSANQCDAGMVKSASAYCATHLLEVTGHLLGERLLSPVEWTAPAPTSNCADLSDVSGQQLAKRALLIAAAGGHNLILTGPPGTGKTMLATRLAGLLPPLSDAEAIECAAIQSVSGMEIEPSISRTRPYRAPHHTTSSIALVGGGTSLRPGEISLAHNGVLFLDELPEFSRHVLEVLREPLESKYVTISRASGQVRYPANFQLIAAMNPCPCGWFADPSSRCQCSDDQIRRYRSRLSGPLLDRIDLHVDVPALNPACFEDDPTDATTHSSATLRVLADIARERQLHRAGRLNQMLGVREIRRDCRLTPPDRVLLRQAGEKLGLSARAWHRILRVARTIADLSEEPDITTSHLSEAIAYRGFQDTSLTAR